MPLTDRAMLRLHIEAVWGVKLPPIEQNEISLLPGSTQPSWRLCAAEIAGERILIWRTPLASEERAQILAYLDQVEQSPVDLSQPGVSREVAFRLVATPAIDLPTARQIARPLTPDDYPLIETFLHGEMEKPLRPAVLPVIGVVVDGRLLTLAHSSRRTADACELGIDTLSEARRKGYALAATVVWSAAILEEGLTPLYSAFATNTASLHLAETAGYREFTRAVTLE